MPAASSVKVPFLYSSSGSAHLRGANRGATEALAVRILEVSLLLRMQHSLEDLTWVCSAFSWTSTYQAVTLHLMSPIYLFQTLLPSSSSRDYLPLSSLPADQGSFGTSENSTYECHPISQMRKLRLERNMLHACGGSELRAEL